MTTKMKSAQLVTLDVVDAAPVRHKKTQKIEQELYKRNTHLAEVQGVTLKEVKRKRMLIPTRMLNYDNEEKTRMSEGVLRK